jgi:hypothetical protein
MERKYIIGKEGKAKKSRGPIWQNILNVFCMLRLFGHFSTSTV